MQFGTSPLIDQIAREYVAFLKGNKVTGVDFALAVEQIDAYTCQRLGNSPKWTYDSELRVSQTSPTVKHAQGKCGGCGVRL